MEDTGGDPNTGGGTSKPNDSQPTSTSSEKVQPDQNRTGHTQIPGDKDKTRRHYFRELIEEGPDRHIELLLTIAIATFSCFQLLITCSNNASSSRQSERLLQSANRIDDAADSFSGSASKINGGVADAVAKLQSQADALAKLRDTWSQSVGLQQDALEVGLGANRPILQISFSPIPEPRLGPAAFANLIAGDKSLFQLKVQNTGVGEAVNIHYVISRPHSMRWDLPHIDVIEEAVQRGETLGVKPFKGRIPDLIGHGDSEPVQITSDSVTSLTLPMRDIGEYFYGELDWDDAIGFKHGWRRVFCIKLGYQGMGYALRDCDIAEEGVHERDKSQGKHPQPKR